MTTLTNPLFFKLFHLLEATVQSLKVKMSYLWEGKPDLSAQESSDKKSNKKWVIAETTDLDNQNKNVMMVEVEYFNDPDADLPLKTHNYTIDGEDPNLRITHYPSNRLH